MAQCERGPIIIYLLLRQWQHTYVRALALRYVLNPEDAGD